GPVHVRVLAVPPFRQIRPDAECLGLAVDVLAHVRDLKAYRAVRHLLLRLREDLAHELIEDLQAKPLDGNQRLLELGDEIRLELLEGGARVLDLVDDAEKVPDGRIALPAPREVGIEQRGEPLLDIEIRVTLSRDSGRLVELAGDLGALVFGPGPAA